MSLQTRTPAQYTMCRNKFCLQSFFFCVGFENICGILREQNIQPWTKAKITEENKLLRNNRLACGCLWISLRVDLIYFFSVIQSLLASTGRKKISVFLFGLMNVEKVKVICMPTLMRPRKLIIEFLALIFWRMNFLGVGVGRGVRGCFD